MTTASYKFTIRQCNWESAKKLAAEYGLTLNKTGDGQTAVVAGDSGCLRAFVKAVVR